MAEQPTASSDPRLSSESQILSASVSPGAHYPKEQTCDTLETSEIRVTHGLVDVTKDHEYVSFGGGGTAVSLSLEPRL